jgi:CheY-like chemotaxis protein
LRRHRPCLRFGRGKEGVSHDQQGQRIGRAGQQLDAGYRNEAIRASRVPADDPEHAAPIGDEGATVTRWPRSVVAVSRDPERAELLNALADAFGYNVVHVETIASGYSRIRQVMPDLIILYCEVDDVAACRLLSMLKFDGDLLAIPVATFATGRSYKIDDIVSDMIGEPSSSSQAIQMN